MAQIAFIYRQGVHEVCVATHDHLSGPQLIRSQPAQDLRLQS